MNNEVAEVDLRSCCGVIKRGIVWVVILACLAGAGAYLYVLSKPTYTSEVIMQRSDLKIELPISFLDLKSYKDLAVSRKIIDQAVEKADVDNWYSPSCRLMDNTLALRANSDSPAVAFRFADAWMNQLIEADRESFSAVLDTMCAQTKKQLKTVKEQALEIQQKYQAFVEQARIDVKRQELEQLKEAHKTILAEMASQQQQLANASGSKDRYRMLCLAEQADNGRWGGLLQPAAGTADGRGQSSQTTQPAGHRIALEVTNELAAQRASMRDYSIAKHVERTEVLLRVKEGLMTSLLDQELQLAAHIDNLRTSVLSLDEALSSISDQAGIDHQILQAKKAELKAQLEPAQKKLDTLRRNIETTAGQIEALAREKTAHTTVLENFNTNIEFLKAQHTQCGEAYLETHGLYTVAFRDCLVLEAQLNKSRELMTRHERKVVELAKELIELEQKNREHQLRVNNLSGKLESLGRAVVEIESLIASPPDRLTIASKPAEPRTPSNSPANAAKSVWAGVFVVGVILLIGKGMLADRPPQPADSTQ